MRHGEKGDEYKIRTFKFWCFGFDINTGTLH